MNQDRELLELAAKAAGIVISEHIGIRSDYFADDSTGKEWNPLTDDGDALRLAVTLQMTVLVHQFTAMAETGAVTFQAREKATMNYSIGEATRRAIVRAAAAIGEVMA